MSFFQNTCKPEGIGGKIMVNMMNAGHSSMAEWGFTHIEIRNDYRHNKNDRKNGGRKDDKI